MKFLLMNHKTKEQKIINYPRNDTKPVIGLDKDLEIFVIADNMPEYDLNKQYLIPSIFEITEQYDKDFKHLRICKQNHIVVDLQKIDDPVTDLENLILIAVKEKNERTQEEEIKLIELINKIKNKKTA